MQTILVTYQLLPIIYYYYYYFIIIIFNSDIHLMVYSFILYTRY